MNEKLEVEAHPTAISKSRPLYPLAVLWRRIRRNSRVTVLVFVVAAWLFNAILEDVTTPVLDRMFAPVDHWFNEMMCSSEAPAKRADEMTDEAKLALARKDVTRAETLLALSVKDYRASYKCGNPDAGLRLAVAYCMGMGVPLDRSHGRELILEIEHNFPNKQGRASDARRYCEFDS